MTYYECRTKLLDLKINRIGDFDGRTFTTVTFEVNKNYLVDIVSYTGAIEDELIIVRLQPKPEFKYHLTLDYINDIEKIELNENDYILRITYYADNGTKKIIYRIPSYDTDIEIIEIHNCEGEDGSL